MSESLEFLVNLLDVETIEVNTFRESIPKKSASAPSAARSRPRRSCRGTHGRTRQVHSLHSYFLRPGDPRIPILYEVDRIRDGRSFTTRRVVAIQHGKAIYNMQASFHTEESSLEHQFEMPEVPDPESIRPLAERVASEFGTSTNGSSVNTHRPAFHRRTAWSPLRSKEPRQRIWIKADGVLPDDPLLHACVVTYASDMSLFDAILAPHSVRWDDGTFMARVWTTACGSIATFAPTNGCSTTPTHHCHGDEASLGFPLQPSGELKVSMVQEVSPG